ncbi:peroxidase [Massilia sp. CCM 8734]|uniref:Dyp-type peroxidase n=1 Tax=Massilia sp. CCM 8734 TaxID=2609283 RepID=UPI00141DFF5F|nr:peroxidase [Massilia sp. CCM 8734]NHZ96179.1 peroxidase [Massilia sp. CCM 8734]
MSDSAIDLDDVQGVILRGYRVRLVRHFVLTITDAAATGKLIEALVRGRAGFPMISSARIIEPKPSSFLNISFSAAGLAALGVTAAQLASFDPAFQRGATDPVTAATVGDLGPSAPERWIGGLDNAARVHIVLSLWVASSAEVMETVSVQLRAAFVGGVSELYVQDGGEFPDNTVHFGYRHGIAQPTIIGMPRRERDAPDAQPHVPAGEFLLGHMNAAGGTYRVLPQELSSNSSYGVFRILEQDVAGFEAMLARYAAETGIDTEILAAKLMGRWRNGNPLTLTPTAQGAPLPDAQLNRFEFVGSDPATDDTLGLKCPIGAHIRRNNPRDAAVIGTDSTHHRLVRRSIPYGRQYDRARPDTHERGLIGFFINASIRNQFEFLSSEWNRRDDFVKSATGPEGAVAGNAVYNISGEDFLAGVNDPASSAFTLPGKGPKGSANRTLDGFSRLVTTRGGVYCFFPSIKGLLYLAQLTAAAGSTPYQR